MLGYTDRTSEQQVAIDENHANLVQSLIMCRKPREILELGFGAGGVTRCILAGLHHNGGEHSYTVVDNWWDFGGQPPAAIADPQYAGIDFVTASECDYLLTCKTSYDFIFSDADHMNTQNWFELVYNRFLARGGILIYHDVTNAATFPHLLRIYQDAVRLGYHHILFNQSTRDDERCDRGLLVIFKH